MNHLPEILHEVARAAAAANSLDFLDSQEDYRDGARALREIQQEALADALHQAIEHIHAITGEYGVEIF